MPWTYARAVIEFTTAVIDTESVEEVLWLLTDDIVQDLGFEDCVIYLMDEVRSKLVQRAAYGNKKSGTAAVLNPIELDLGEGITGRCATEQQPILVNDVSKHPSYVRDDKVRMSELAVPILRGGAAIGVIDSEHSSKNFYNSQHVATLKALSPIITTRYENSRALRTSAKARRSSAISPTSTHSPSSRTGTISWTRLLPQLDGAMRASSRASPFSFLTWTDSSSLMMRTVTPPAMS